MIIEKISAHMAFQFEKDEEFFELGYKVLDKQHLDNMLSSIHIQYNLKDRLLYDIEQYEVLDKLLPDISEEDAISIIQDFFCLVVDIGNNGFIPIEAISVGTDTIFWDVKTKRAFFVVLPISQEYSIGDGRSWNKRMWDMLNELLAKINIETEKIITDNLSQTGKFIDNVEKLIPVLKNYKNNINRNINIGVDQLEMQLIHDGIYGQFAFYIRKKEFIIGKLRNSVDGFLGMSDAVSRIHCKILRRNNRFYVSDMGSSNHTYINGILIMPQQERELVEGDRLRIADIDFRIHIMLVK